MQLSSRELREALIAASRALARLDADRLEELALSCQALVSGFERGAGANLQQGSRPRDGGRELTELGLVLRATQANLAVLRGLRRGGATELEYGQAAARAGTAIEAHDGDH
jgi:hypothetical protein